MYMKARSEKISKYTTEDGYQYLTKRTLVRRAKTAGRIAAKNAMSIMGYVVTVRDGWVVKIHENGQIEQLKQLENL
jgi:hypothetical protein